MQRISTGEYVGNLTEDSLEIGEVLGRGACGFVYKAIHKPTGR